MSVLDLNGQPLKSERYDVLGVVAQQQPGIFEVKFKGNKISVDNVLLLPVKGAKYTSLKMKVIKVEPLITPIGSWSAVCEGPKYKEFDLKNIEANCDACNESFSLEFIAYSDDQQADALNGMKMQGWDATLKRQVCPSCSDI